MSTETKTDLPLPPVSVDISLGKQLDSIEVDQEAIARSMLEQGVSPDDIGDTSIHFTGDISKNISGQYNPQSKQITVGVTGSYSSGDEVILNKSLGTNRESNKILAHELQHRIDDTKGQLLKDDIDYRVARGKFTVLKMRTAARALIVGSGAELAIEGVNNKMALGLFTASAVYLAARKIKSRKADYLNHPSEIRAREQETGAPSFVKVVPQKRVL